MPSRFATTARKIVCIGRNYVAHAKEYVDSDVRLLPPPGPSISARPVLSALSRSPRSILRPSTRTLCLVAYRIGLPLHCLVQSDGRPRHNHDEFVRAPSVPLTTPTPSLLLLGLADLRIRAALLTRPPLEPLCRLNNPLPSAPFYFLKPPSSMIWSDASAHAAASGPSPGGTSIEVPLDDMDHVHHEVELVRS